jgi:hypothetical protein
MPPDMAGPRVPVRPGIPAGPGPPQARGDQGADHQAGRRLDRAHLAPPAEAFRLLQGRLDVGDADAEDHVTVITCAPPVPPGMPVRSLVGSPFTNPWFIGSDTVSAARTSGVEFLAEPLTDVTPELLVVLADDFEVHHRLGHGQSSPAGAGPSGACRGGRSPC